MHGTKPMRIAGPPNTIQRLLADPQAGADQDDDERDRLELGQQVAHFRIDQIEGAGPEEHACSDHAQNAGQSDAAEHQVADQGSEDDNGDVGQHAAITVLAMREA